MSSRTPANDGLLAIFHGELGTQVAALGSAVALLEGGGRITDVASIVRTAQFLHSGACLAGVDVVADLAGALLEAMQRVAAQGFLLTEREAAPLRSATVCLGGVQAAATDLEAWIEQNRMLLDECRASLKQIIGTPQDPGGAPPASKTAPTTQSTQRLGDLSATSMLELFRNEVELRAGELNEGFLTLERDPDAVQVVPELMRAAHSIKGVASVVELFIVTHLAHMMEDCLVAVQQGRLTLDSEAIDLFLEATDALIDISRVPEQEIPVYLAMKEVDLKALTNSFAEIRDGKTRTRRAASEQLGNSIGARQASGTSRAAPAATAPGERPAAGGRQTTHVREVRMTLVTLNRLMALAGETTVEAGWFDPYGRSLLRFKAAQLDLSDVLERMESNLAEANLLTAVGPDLKDAQLRVTECIQLLADRLSEFEDFSRRTANLSGRLYREVIASRMRPFSDAMKSFPRRVRDLAKALGKQVRLEVRGENTEVDRDILDRLDAPLNHIVRNNLDHGIAAPEERTASGKSPTGTITLQAEHRAGMLVVTVSDDGRGVDLGAVRRKIVDLGMAKAETVGEMSDHAVLEHIFMPGFSTAKSITEISGRGVGLDVVRSMVSEVGGTVRVETEWGRGTSFILELPLTRSVVRTLLVEVGREPFAVPLHLIDRAWWIPIDTVQAIEGRQYAVSAEGNVGLVFAHQVLQIQENTAPGQTLAVVVLSHRGRRYGLVVDRFLGEQDLVVRPLDSRLGKVDNIDAVSTLPDGTPVLILNAHDIVSTIDGLVSGGVVRSISTHKTRRERPVGKRVLVVDDSIVVREIERTLLEGGGYAVDVAVDGMEAWSAVRAIPYDLVLTDIEMPRMDGIELISHIRHDPHVRSLPIIVVSTETRADDRLRGLEAGANYYLSKANLHDGGMLQAVMDLIGKGGA